MNDKQPPPDWWPCACVKRNKKNDLTHIKLHPPTTKACNVCGIMKPK